MITNNICSHAAGSVPSVQTHEFASWDEYIGEMEGAVPGWNTVVLMGWDEWTNTLSISMIKYRHHIYQYITVRNVIKDRLPEVEKYAKEQLEYLNGQWLATGGPG